MEKRIARAIIAILSIVCVYHFLMLAGILPMQMAWGGRLQSASDLYIMEAVSISINLLVMVTVAQKTALIKGFLPVVMLRPLMVVFVVLFSLNTIGNLFATTTIEKSFSIITLFLALAITKMLWKKP
jgi:hypothetical protein